MTDETVDTTESDAEESPANPADGVDAEAEGAEGDAADGTDGADVVARAADYDEDLAAAVGDLRARADDLESELVDARERGDDLEDRLKRTKAEFQNYKKRAKKRERQTRERATEDLVERLVPVRDNLLRALDQGGDADIRDGVESTLAELDRVLEDENVEPIEPAPGDEVDPRRHEVMMRVESDQPAETIADVYRPGYEMAEKVIREAQVTVSDGGAE